MFNIDEIKELMALLEDSSLAVLEVEQGDCKVRLKKPAATEEKQEETEEKTEE